MMLPSDRWKRAAWIAVALGCLSGGWDAQALPAADVPQPSLDPRTFGLSVPPGPLKGQPLPNVLMRDASGETVVARTHVQVGSHRLLVLPDGELVARPVQETPETERAFEPLTKDALAKRLLGSLQNGFRTKQTVRYLYVYNTSDVFAEATSRILETMFAGLVRYMQTQKLDVRAPEVPLVAIMFRTEAEFQKYRPMPAGTLAYYDVLSNRIVMYEESQLWRVKPDLAIRQAIATIAHEGAHQILHNIGVQQRLSQWPMWLSEGLAEFFSPTTTDRQMKWKGVGQVNDLRMFELEQYIKTHAAKDANGELVAQTIGAARLTSTGYATAWALTHYLATNKGQVEGFRHYLHEVSRLGPLEAQGHVVPPGLIAENVRGFKEFLSPDLAELERRLLLHLNQLPYVDPFADWPHFVGLLSLPAGRRVRREATVFHTPEQAEKWCREAAELLPAEQRAGVASSVRQFPNRLLAEQFARQWIAGN